MAISHHFDALALTRMPRHPTLYSRQLCRIVSATRLRSPMPYAAKLAARMSAPSARRGAIAKAPRHSTKVIRLPVPELIKLRRRRRLSGLSMVVLVLAMIAAWDQYAGLPTESAGLECRLRPNSTERLLLQRVNAARARAGTSPLAFSSALMRAAYLHSADMAAAGYVAYDSPSGDTPASRIIAQGVDYQELGENLCGPFHDGLARLADYALARWLADPEDRANILSARFRITGIGITRTADGSFYITQDLVR